MWDAKKVILIVMLICVGFVGACWGATDAKAVIAGAGPAKARVLHFPRNRSLGSLYTITDPGKKSKITQYIGPGIFKYWGEWEYFCEATGDVTVPADKWLQLLILIKKPNPDLSPLAKLRPDDLDMVKVVAIPGIMVEPDETIMPHLSGLSSLKLLYIKRTGISSRGLRYIKGLKSLKYLTLFENLDSQALAQLTDLTSLEGLFIDSYGVTDRWLRPLAKLPSLEKLFLQAPRVRGPGLAYLAKSLSLKELILDGRPAGRSAGDPLKYLKDVRSLRRLEVANWPPITDTGLAHISALTELEELSLGQAQITDAGLGHLKTMHSLKKLVLGRVQGRLTDEGLAHLVEIRTLEELGLPESMMTDKGLAYLSQLGNLKKIGLGDVSDDGLGHLEKLKFLEELGIGENEHITDGGLAHIGRLTNLGSLEIKECANVTGAGLKHIGKLSKLESLKIKICKNVTDVGMSHIGRLTDLKLLTLRECPITDKGLAELAALKSLESIELKLEKASIAGLNHLNEMPRLTRICAAVGNHGESNLNWVGLTKLKKLEIGIYERGIHDEDLACLVKLKPLERLYIGGPISDAGLAHLAGLTNLRRLSIGRVDDYAPRLTDVGLSYLRNLNKLERLNVSGANNFTDKGLRHLEGLTALLTLVIRCKNENPFSRRAVARLRSKLPYLHTFRVNGQRVGDEVVRTEREGPRRPLRRPSDGRERPIRGRPRRW